jgi:hypothetical protein
VSTHPLYSRGRRQSRATTLRSLWAFMTCSRANFTFICSKTISLGNKENPSNVTLFFTIYFLSVTNFNSRKMQQEAKLAATVSWNCSCWRCSNYPLLVPKHDPKIPRKIWESARKNWVSLSVSTRRHMELRATHRCILPPVPNWWTVKEEYEVFCNSYL